VVWTRPVAAALLLEEGHDVVAATMKLWGGAGDSGCCSVGDVDDARRVAARLGIDIMSSTSPRSSSQGRRTLCEAHASTDAESLHRVHRHLKFRRFLDRALRLGFERWRPGITPASRTAAGRPPRLLRGTDAAKDQSYVLSVLTIGELARVLLPVGELTKRRVRALRGFGLATATKPEQPGVCFVAAGRTRPRRRFCERIELHPGASSIVRREWSSAPLLLSSS